MRPVRGSVLTRAHALRGLSAAEIIDSRSSCARTSEVFTTVYRKPEEGSPLIRQYHGKVLVHPDIELIRGAAPGLPIKHWNNADLAVIFLDEPVNLDFQPVALSDSDVKLGDAFVIVGYAGGASANAFGSREFGGNKVTNRITYATGNVIFSAAVAPGAKSSTAAVARPGDSGGACLRKEDQRVLIGVVSLGMETVSGTEVTFFTSIYPYRDWLLENIRQANLAADAGVNVPG